MNGGFALLAVATAAAGYILASECLKHRYKLSRQSGHRLYLSTLKLGVYALFAALLVTWLATKIGINASQSVMGAFLTVAFAKIYSEIYNRKPRLSCIWAILCNAKHAGATKTLKRLKAEFEEDELTRFNAIWTAWQEDDVELICAYAAEEMKPIAITLDTNKVYVGMVADTLEPSDSKSYLSILPIYSGYRDKEKLSFKLDRKYDTLLQGLLNEDEDVLNAKLDYVIAIPIDRIVTLHVFNEDLYQEVSGASTADIGEEQEN